MKRRSELILLFIWPLAVGAIFLTTHVNIVVSAVLFFGVPGACLSFRMPRIAPRALLFSVIAGPLVGIPFEAIIEAMRIYIVPSSIFGGFRLFGFVTVDVLIWAVLWFFFVIMFYEAEFNLRTANKPLVRPRMKVLVGILGVMFLVFVTVFMRYNAPPHVDFWYLKYGIVVVVLPLLAFLWRYPRMRMRLLVSNLYYVVVFSVHELASLRLGLWYFPDSGQTIGRFTVLGQTMAFEELLVFILLSGITVVAYYEYFDDDSR